MNRLVYVAVALSLVACSGSKGHAGSPSVSAAASSTPAATSAAPASSAAPTTAPTTSAGTPTSTPTTKKPTPTKTKASVPNVKAQVLVLSDLPAGWSRQKVDNDTSGEPACFKEIDAKTGKPAAHVEVAFQGSPEGLPALDETLNYVKSSVKADFAIVVKGLSHCRKVSISSGGATLTGSIVPISFPKVGDESRAYQMLLSGVVRKVRVTVGFDILTFGVGHEEVTLVLSTVGPPVISDLEGAARLALGRIQGTGGGTTT